MLLAFSGAGAVVGSLIVAWLGRFPRMGVTTLTVEVLFGALITLMALNRSLHLTYLLLFLSGVALMIVLSLVLTITWRPPLTIAYFWDDPVRNLQITTGPALALGVALAAMMARITRSSVLEVLGEDYVRTARAKGLRERAIVWRHALVNAMLPILTVTGTALGALLGGSVAVERAFSVPGLGLALVFAVAERDWMLIQNLVLLYGVIFVLVNLVVDVSYGWFDPRIRYQ